MTSRKKYQKYPLKHILEYIAVRILAGIIIILPYRLALLFGWITAWISFRIFRYRVKSAKKRISQVFGNRFTKREITNIAWLSWRNFIFSIIEMMIMPRLDLSWIKRVFKNDNAMNILKAHFKTGAGAVLACPHTGSWETASIACHFNEIPIFIVTGKQKNILVDNYINKLRKSPGIDIIPRGSGTMKTVISKLKTGKGLAIMPDVRAKIKGVSVPFLGGNAIVGEGMALFAKHTKVPVFLCVLIRNGWSQHILKIYGPFKPDKNMNKKEDVKRITLETFKVIDKIIMDDPKQWFWFNKRWILDPIT